MTTVSIDVGIKHLAICVLDGEWIRKWEVFNLLLSKEETQQGGVCSWCKKKARYWNASDHDRLYCLVHAKMTVQKEEGIWWSRWGPKKQDVMDACPLWLRTREGLTAGSTKEQWIEKMMWHAWQPIPPVKKAGEVSLIDIGKGMVMHLDAFFLGGDLMETVLIENQISPIANRMKTLQGMLTAYFLIRFPVAKIQFVSSSNKLRGLGKEVQLAQTGQYAQHKLSAVELCRQQLGEQQGGWLEWFEQQKKKDDLADCYLQAIHNHKGKLLR